MKKENTVQKIKGEERAGTFLVAEGFQSRHDRIVQLVKEYHELSMKKCYEQMHPKEIPQRGEQMNKIAAKMVGVHQNQINAMLSDFISSDIGILYDYEFYGEDGGCIHDLNTGTTKWFSIENERLIFD